MIAKLNLNQIKIIAKNINQKKIQKAKAIITKINQFIKKIKKILTYYIKN